MSVGQSGSGGGNAGPADLDGAGIELPGIFAVTMDELQLCACHVSTMNKGCDTLVGRLVTAVRRAVR